MARIILASSSPYRQQLLHKLGLDFQSCSPDIDETARPDESATDLVQRLAEQKARAVATLYPQGLIIGSDQVCVNQGQILGKPGTLERARAQLLDASGQRITFYTGLAVLDAASDRLHSMVEPFSVVFRNLSEAQIDRYLNKEPALDCAGAFKCEGLGISLFERMEGRDPNSLVGLPLIALVELLSQFEVEIP
ncbi:Maf family protein [Oceanisphaera arctica]|uniref:7-methyl-GTP pyrophosphatase n=1 Tax=Oceanisphaera arctica TaxID=641510 RepID=A0A2P5TJT4_9GAMM|nr:nucleoside triphosphate pyrophosphatase [Oceanisphaera arctica]PPL15325.1 septum formation protein Maf [Oceanisphaera arctica]GHA29173.1 Maf-like protein [Oceanisphaera arctica]